MPYPLPTRSYFTLPYLTLPFLTLPYLTLPYLTLPYLTLPYLTLSYLILSYLTLPHLTLPCPVLRCCRPHRPGLLRRSVVWNWLFFSGEVILTIGVWTSHLQRAFPSIRCVCRVSVCFHDFCVCAWFGLLGHCTYCPVHQLCMHVCSMYPLFDVCPFFVCVHASVIWVYAFVHGWGVHVS